MNPCLLEHFLRLVCLVSITLLTCQWPSGARAEEPIANPPAWTLRVKNGDIYRGAIAITEEKDSLSWECPSFMSPLAFPWNEVQSIEKNRTVRLSSPNDAVDSSKLFAVEQHSGITLSGEILGINKDQIQMQVEGMDMQIIPLTEIKNILRVFSASNEPVQVLQAEDWEQVLPAPKNGRATKWFLKAGEISTDTSGTTISQWGKIPALATVDIDVSWEQPTVNWWLTIGEPRRMELQVRKLQNKNLLNVTLLVENSRDADVASVQIPYPKDSHLGLRLLCDADKGAYVLMMDDQVLGRIKGNTTERIVGRNKFSFTNTALGVLTLRDLRISDRPFAIPEATAESAAGLAEVMTRERGTFVGSIESDDPKAAIQIRSPNGTPVSIPLKEIERIEFPKRTADPNRESRLDLLRVELTNGLRFVCENISSRAVKKTLVEAGDVTVAPELCLEYAGGVLCLPWDAIDRVARIHHEGTQSPATTEDNSRTMQLVTEDVVSTGRVDSVFTLVTGVRTLNWLPANASAPAAIHPAVDGAIEPSVSGPAIPEKRNPRTPAMAIIRADTPKSEPAVSRELSPEEPSLFLVSGDCFPGKVLAGNMEQVEFQSSLFERAQIPADQMRGVRIVEYQGLEALDRAIRMRLLTVTRLQRKHPPTHLIVSRDGDVVRGRILAFDRDQIRMEVRDEERNLATKNVAEIIWLEPAPKLANSASGDAEAAPSQSDSQQIPATANGLYQALLQQGSRISISPVRVTNDELVGEHPLLGPCTLPWEKISRLILGRSIQTDASRSRFGKWKLLNAPDPKFVAEGTPEQNDAPVDTAIDRMIGKPAPDQDLLKLDGTPFRLADYRGKVVILDFWASWCGPCLQGMPRIHQISREYTDAGVEAVFVNIEEAEDRVRALLERLELVPTVAMDTDGSFAKQYAVQAIPQTVVIDRDGVIVKVFIGSGDQTEQELIGILNDLTKN